ncbi:hypothetical protein ONS95_013202 [Cadophora gregata]|uniref:uncharacterized protein n=1 Tax=Cadophora gregata TaxID=51156 RepID=UPI0026DA8D27|nr:uncharacterized protein ONS95_013202 [Cadophora gregata]KAK0116172.1 hypothetical protein ONS95_013202 [Cadophora gregata]
MGPDHEKTILAQENLAVVNLELGKEHYQKAHDMMMDVVDRRIKTMGKEAPWTLMALNNLAWAKHHLGDNLEAEKILREGLVIAHRDVGEDHHGVLSAKRRLAWILAVQGMSLQGESAKSKFEEAEQIFIYLLDRKHYQGGIRVSGAVKGDQRDRIFNLYKFVEFWEMRKVYDKALTHCQELCDILRESDHPIAEMSRKKRASLEQLARNASCIDGS